MTQEQKGAVRADQIEVLTEHFITAGFPPVPARRLAEDTVSEAEARGAEEQRRKDAEGQGPVGWALRPEMRLRSAFAVWPAPMATVQEWNVPLYTHPANVAALEARVKELEAEAVALTRKVALLNDPISGDHYERPDTLYELDMEDSLSGVADESSRGDITRVISWRKLGHIFILNASDENVERFSAFSDENEAEYARAALTREGGE